MTPWHPGGVWRPLLLAPLGILSRCREKLPPVKWKGVLPWSAGMRFGLPQQARLIISDCRMVKLEHLMLGLIDYCLRHVASPTPQDLLVTQMWTVVSRGQCSGPLRNFR